MSGAGADQRQHLVVGGYVESHQSLKEGLRGFVVTEESVSVHIIPGECWLRTIRTGKYVSVDLRTQESASWDTRAG